MQTSHSRVLVNHRERTVWSISPQMAGIIVPIRAFPWVIDSPV
jgi:hypothetical protein